MTPTERGSPRVLITSTPGTGHVLPMVPLGRALQSDGCEVVWATGADARRMVRSAGFRHVPAGLELGVRMQRFRDGWSDITDVPPRDRRAVTFPALFATLSSGPMYDDLVGLTTSFHPDVVVHEACELAGPALAGAVGIPHVTFGLGRPIPSPLLAAAACDVAHLWARAGRTPPEDCGLYDDLYLHPLPEVLETVREARVATFRPLHDHDWISSPRGGTEPRLYVTFGTEFGRAAPWRPLLDALGGLGLTTLATTGPDLDADVVGPLPVCVRLRPWVPQHEAMRQADLVVSHGGAGTLLGAVAAGIPHLVLPLGADHFDNAELVSNCRLGASIEPDAMTADVIAEAIEELTTDDEIGTRVSQAHDAMAALASPSDIATRVRGLAARTA